MDNSVCHLYAPNGGVYKRVYGGGAMGGGGISPPYALIQRVLSHYISKYVKGLVLKIIMDTKKSFK